MLVNKLEWQKYVNLWQRHLRKWCYNEIWLDHATKISYLRAIFRFISHHCYEISFHCSETHDRTFNFSHFNNWFNSFSDPYNIIEFMSWVSHYMLIYGDLKMVKNITIFVYISGGWACVFLSHHLCAYALTNSWFLFFLTIRLFLSGAISTLILYCYKKVSAISLHLLILALSNLIYQCKVDPVRLSWKKYISILSLWLTSSILL